MRPKDMTSIKPKEELPAENEPTPREKDTSMFAKKPLATDEPSAHEPVHIELLQALKVLEELIDDLDEPSARARERAAQVHIFFSTTARDHHLHEEAKIFPPMLQSNDVELVQLVRRLQQDHGWIEEDWLVLDPPLQALIDGQSVFDRELLTRGIPVFTALCREHVALEESEVYPRFHGRKG